MTPADFKGDFHGEYQDSIRSENRMENVEEYSDIPANWIEILRNDMPADYEQMERDANTDANLPTWFPSNGEDW